MGLKAPTASQQLRFKIELGSPRLLAASDRVWSHRRLRGSFPDFLFWVYSIIRASVPLMEAARREAKRRGRRDPVAAGLAAYLATHVVEERHHDEWLLADLDVLDWPRRRVVERLPPPTVAELVGAQYYWMQFVHPVAILGYIAVLEGYPPTERLLASVRARTGLPAKAFRTLVKHARLDPHHRDDLDRVVDRLPLAPPHRQVLGASALQTLHLLSTSLEELLAEPAWAGPISGRTRRRTA